MYEIGENPPRIKLRLQEYVDKMRIVLQNSAKNVVNGWKSGLPAATQSFIGYGRENALKFLKEHKDLFTIEFDETGSVFMAECDRF
ncbi:MAG: hypothetical protein GY820_31360 [Gammaproteobacteria bacterium]|nr:hypothetical protein [Gammaproteobacteria bacterium]